MPAAFGAPSKKKCNGRWLPELLDYDSLAVSQAEFDSEGFGNHVAGLEFDKKLKSWEKDSDV